MDRWRGKVAVVTGASSGIGADIAKKLVEEGLIVAGLARRVERVQDLSKTLIGKAGKLHALKCDVSKPDEIIASFKWIRKNVGPVHILINNAGLFFKGTIVEGNPTDWKTTLDTNVLGVSVCSQEAIKHMREKDSAGHIVHINSIAGHWPLIGNPPVFNVYSPSKFAITTLTEVMRQELAHYKTKIKVTSVSPGLVDTEIFDVGGLDKKTDFRSFLHLKPADITNAVLYTLGTPPEVLSVSPGLVDTEIFDAAGLDETTDFRSFLHLKPEDITNDVLYALGTPPEVLIQEIIVRPLGSM